MGVADERRPGRAGPYMWEPDRDDDEAWILRREGVDHTATFSGRGVVEHCRGMYRKEKEVQAALASEDPTVLCRLGWHELESADDGRVFFRYMSGTTGRRLNFGWERNPPNGQQPRSPE
jgi:hypothetical protein